MFGSVPVPMNLLDEYSCKIKKLRFNPGEKFYYNNINFVILGEIISKISGISFEEYMINNIFQPLEMYNSSFFAPDSVSSLIALIGTTTVSSP